MKSILHKKSQELGRSMIEMLGVLAIVGVPNFAIDFPFDGLDTPTKDKVCRKILLSGIETELGTNLIRMIVKTDSGYHNFDWQEQTVAFDKYFPITINDASISCTGSQKLLFYVK